MGSKFHTRNITCIAFPIITVSNTITKISEYGKVIYIYNILLIEDSISCT